MHSLSLHRYARRFSEHNCEATKMQLHAINILFLGESVRSTENIKLNWQQKLRVICVKTSTVRDTKINRVVYFCHILSFRWSSGNI